MLQKTRNSGWIAYVGQRTRQKILGSIREKWRWRWSTTCVRHFRGKTRKVALLWHGGCTSNSPKSGYACPFGNILVPRVAHVHGEAVGHLGPDRLHYPKRHGRLRAKTRFSRRFADPPYKSRGCGMPGAGFRATISPECIYGV